MTHLEGSRDPLIRGGPPRAVGGAEGLGRRFRLQEFLDTPYCLLDTLSCVLDTLFYFLDTLSYFLDTFSCFLDTLSSCLDTLLGLTSTGVWGLEFESGPLMA